MKILGLTSGIHDTSATLVVDGKIVAASAEERFTRVKHDGRFPLTAIRFCLDQGKVGINEIDEVVIGMKWLERAQARLELRSDNSTELKKRAEYQAQIDRNRHGEVKKILSSEFGYRGRISFLDHYDCHASACYFTSPFQSAVILILDGAGERASARIYKASGTKFETLLQIDYPNSAGRFYGWITDYLGFKIDADEGKMMGLAPYGNESLIEKMRDVLKIKSDGTYDLDLSYFDFVKDNTKGVSEKFIKIFGAQRRKDEPLIQRHKNIAKAAQVVLEETVMHMTKLAKEMTGEKKLCFGGGVALNSVANGKVVLSGLFDDVFIYPASGDDGTGLGAALYAYYSKQNAKEFYADNQSPYLGFETSEEEILGTIKEYKLNFEKPEDIFRVTARLLADNKIVGWFSGRAEFGPRALGNRSILADPRDESNKDRVNLKIKQRESFRPFAPSVIEEYADEYFEINGVKSPYMIMTFPVREDKKNVIPAVTHVDDSARVQTVSKKINERYWNLLNEFYQITGVPVLLNTSFNRRGEPIVNNPKEAIEDFLNSELDVLALGKYLITKD